MIAVTPDQSRKLALLIRDLSPIQKADFYYFTIVENQDPYKFLASIPVKKHGDHDQSSHGSWAQGVLASAEVQLDGKKIGEIINRVKDEGGLTISMIDGSEPQTGFTFARGRKYSSIVDAQTFYKDEDVLASYYIKHKADLTGGKYHLGLWHNDADGQVYLDVSENIQDRERAIAQGIKNDQISIWDVVNKKEIPTGGSGAVKEVRSSRDTRYVKNDRRGNSGLRQRDLGEVRKTLKVIYFDYGLKPVFKHEGGPDHEQVDHGNWARGYTSAEIELIETMKDKGPSVEDLNSAVSESGTYSQTDEQLELIVRNDGDLYRDATAGIDARVEERLESLQEEFPNHEYTGQEKNEIYENVQDELIDNYVESQRDTLTELAAGMDSGEFSVSAQELIPFFDEVYGVEHTGNNFDGEERTIVSKISDAQVGYRGDGSIIIEGSIENENEELIGFIQREFFKENGVWNVEHLALVIEEQDYKGTGFGKEIIQNSEAWYVARGFGYIEVSTAMDGARHWARAGYDFNPEYLRENARELIVAADGRFEAGTPERAQFDNLMGRYLDGYTPSSQPIYAGVRDMKDERFPLPADFANIGYTAGAKQWAGKDLMSSLNMKYVKVLTPEGQKLMDGPIDHDGDGLIYDGTAREKPAPSGGKK